MHPGSTMTVPPEGVFHPQSSGRPGGCPLFISSQSQTEPLLCAGYCLRCWETVTDRLYKNPQHSHPTRPAEAEPQTRIQDKDQERREEGDREFGKVYQEGVLMSNWGSVLLGPGGTLQSRPQGWPMAEQRARVFTCGPGLPWVALPACPTKGNGGNMQRGGTSAPLSSPIHVQHTF